MPYEVGQTATNPKTGQKVKWDGSNWVGIPGTGGGKGAGAALSPGDRQFLNTLSQQAADAGETRRVYERARSDVHTLQTGPYRGRFMQMATPEDNGGILDTIGSVVLGAPARLLGAIRGKETDAYQRLRGLQSQQVLQGQLAQKGPQTESDAARLMLTEISPSKTVPTNEDIISKGVSKADRARAKSVFYTWFANKYGLHGLSPHGYTADQLWANNPDGITQQAFGRTQQGSAPPIKVLSRTKVK